VDERSQTREVAAGLLEGCGRRATLANAPSETAVYSSWDFTLRDCRLLSWDFSSLVALIRTGGTSKGFSSSQHKAHLVQSAREAQRGAPAGADQAAGRVLAIRHAASGSRRSVPLP
jgi:hypothetical protein